MIILAHCNPGQLIEQDAMTFKPQRPILNPSIIMIIVSLYNTV